MLRRLILRLQGSPTDDQDSQKKPRRSQRLSQRGDRDGLKTPVQNKHHLPSPVTHLASESTTEYDKEVTATPPQDRPSQIAGRRADDNNSQGLAFSSPPQDTQAFSQQDFDPNAPLVEGVDELKEGVWGYLLPLDNRFLRGPWVFRKKESCTSPAVTAAPAAAAVAKKGNKKKQETPGKEQDQHDNPGGYLLGRHPKCST